MIILLLQGKHNPQAVDHPVTDKKNPYFLVLISDNFVEASNALSRPAVKLQPSQGIINVDGPSGSSSISSISGGQLSYSFNFISDQFYNFIYQIW